MKQKATKFFAILLAMAPAAFGQTVVNVTSADIQGSVHWTADKIYVLNGFVFVEDGETLTIDPGTVVKGKQGTGASAAALIVKRGGKIFANGTENQPIIFTSELDDVTDPNDMLPTDRGKWGGIILLGKATLNTATPVQAVEGIPSTLGALFGCNRDDLVPTEVACDDADNSGILHYVSIRHGGTQLEAGNEINGLTLAGVGSGTTVDHVEVMYNADDGFEFFGGTVNTKYLVSAFNDDDAFDYDQGWRGKNQFWFAIQAEDTGDNNGEFDGGDDPAPTGQPYAIPTINNATFIGSGATAANTKSYGLLFRVNAGGKFYNSIVTGIKSKALTIEDLATSDVDSRQRLEMGDLAIKNNIFGAIGSNLTLEQAITQEFVRTYFAANQNVYADPMLISLGRMPGQKALDPRPAAASPALSSATAALPQGDVFFSEAGYIGAFGSTNWLAGWSGLARLGYLEEGTSTPIEEPGGSLAREFRLAQNYPNPVTRYADIEYQLGQAQQVTLAVFDVLGRRVTTLVDRIEEAGLHRVRFDAADLSSGTYIYQLRTREGVVSRTMAVVR